MPFSKKRRSNAGPATLADVYVAEIRSIKARLKAPIVVETRLGPTQGGLTGFGFAEGKLTDEEIDQQYLSKGIEKLRLALQYFKIDSSHPDAWLFLSFCLAKKLGWLNRASKPSKRSGRPPEWCFEDYLALTRDISVIETERRLGIQDACRTLKGRVQNGKMARPAWMTGKSIEDLKPTSLANRYSKAKEQVDRLFGLARLGFTEM
jgi:hypothetical protein